MFRVAGILSAAGRQPIELYRGRRVRLQSLTDHPGEDRPCATLNVTCLFVDRLREKGPLFVPSSSTALSSSSSSAANRSSSSSTYSSFHPPSSLPSSPLLLLHSLPLLLKHFLPPIRLLPSCFFTLYCFTILVVSHSPRRGLETFFQCASAPPPPPSHSLSPSALRGSCDSR